MKKQIIAAILAAALLLSGCGSAQPKEADVFSEYSDEKVISYALEQLEELDSWSYSYKTDLDFSFFDDYAGRIHALQSEGEVLRAPFTMHATFDGGWTGTTKEEYLREVDYSGEAAIICAMLVAGSTAEQEPEWYAKVLEKTAQDPNYSTGALPSARFGNGYCFDYGTALGTGPLFIADNIWRFLAAGTDFTRKGTSRVGGRSAVRFEGTVFGEKLGWLLDFSNIFPFASISLFDTDEQIKEGIPISIYLDAETALPVRVEVDFTELMQQELAQNALRDYVCRMLSTMPNSSFSAEEMLAMWDDEVAFRRAKVTIDISIDPVEIVLPKEVRPLLPDW